MIFLKRVILQIYQYEEQLVGNRRQCQRLQIEINGYRYICYVTTLEFGAADVWRLYRGRANCESGDWITVKMVLHR